MELNKKELLEKIENLIDNEFDLLIKDSVKIVLKENIYQKFEEVSSN